MEIQNDAVDIIPQSIVNSDLEFSARDLDIGSERINNGACEKPIFSQTDNQNKNDNVVVRVRSLTPVQILATLVCAFGISVAFYFEIPVFARALTGGWVMWTMTLSR